MADNGAQLTAGLPAANHVATPPPPPPRPAKLDGSDFAQYGGPLGAPIAPSRPRNTLWMAIGGLLIVLAGLGAASLAVSLNDRVDVLVASRPISAGDPIGEGDFVVGSVSVPGGVQFLTVEQLPDVIGLRAAGPIGPGAIVHPDQLVQAGDIDEEQVILGASLAAGAYPRSGLRPGDLVKIIEVTGNTRTERNPRELTEAEIVEVSSSSSNGTRLISFRVDNSIAPNIADLSAKGLIRLALVDNGSLEGIIDPLDPVVPVAPIDPDSDVASTPEDDEGP